MVSILAVLGVAGIVAGAPHGFTAPPLALPPLAERAGPPGTALTPRLEPGRLALAGAPDATSGTLRFVAGLGASLAWELADLPRHQARLPEPIGGFVPGAGFRAHLARGASAEGGAIAALTGRWNTLYPPYAFEGPAWP